MHIWGRLKSRTINVTLYFQIERDIFLLLYIAIISLFLYKHTDFEKEQKKKNEQNIPNAMLVVNLQLRENRAVGFQRC